MGHGYGTLPLGIEQVVARAAADPAFARDLLADRRAALEANGIALTSTERAVIESLDEPLLTGMIAGLAENLVDLERRAFLGKSSAVAALVLGGAQLSGCENKKKPRPATPGAKAGPRPASEEDAKQQQVRPARLGDEERVVGTLGIRPDIPVRESNRSLIESGDPGASVEKAFEGMGGLTVPAPDEGKP